jgi:hypothetical protein
LFGAFAMLVKMPAYSKPLDCMWDWNESANQIVKIEFIRVFSLVLRTHGADFEILKRPRGSLFE